VVKGIKYMLKAERKECYTDWKNKEWPNRIMKTSFKRILATSLFYICDLWFQT
jgi:hypothetical protein